ncbi:MAG: gluconate 2-dehydrogenase subunit 3 family protein [Bryobacteraceae bacterium]|nr:gluconate 2-dehydrogenase subunit 3 family protein [Bryobacteraceae bacterium]MDW8376896.1 gluconate 2-dehydrogenase subunit 3 family protein [Bryobacterales bacterium]
MSEELVQPCARTTRRDALRNIAFGLTTLGGGSLTVEAAQHVHSAVAAERAAGPYRPKAFSEQQWVTLRRLVELIVPADAVSPSALDAGAPEFIDLLASQNPELARIYYGGFAWLDAEMRRRYGKPFASAKTEQQVAMLDALVEAERLLERHSAEEAIYRRGGTYKMFSRYTTQPGTPLAAGVRFFDWVRKMTVDAYYTSAVGIRDLGFVGNTVLSKYEVPVEVVEYALKRSPFGAR